MFNVDPTRFLRELPPGSVCLVEGAPGTGKTRAVQAAGRAGAFRRRVVFDPYAYRDRLELRRGKLCSPWPGELGTTEELLADVSASPAGHSLLDRDPVSLVIGAHNLDSQALARDFTRVAELCWSTGDVDLLCEEAGLYSREAAELIMRYASGGRHVGGRLVIIAQSIGRVTIEARRYLSHILAFAMGETSDVDDHRKRCGAAFVEELRRRSIGDPPIGWRLGQSLTQQEKQCPSSPSSSPTPSRSPAASRSRRAPTSGARSARRSAS